MWRSSLALVATTVLVAAGAVSASAARSGSRGAPERVAPGVEASTAMAYDGRRWVMAGGRVPIVGRVSDQAPGATVSVEVTSRGRRVAQDDVSLGSGGRFESAFTPRRPGRFLISVMHAEAEVASTSVHAVAARARRGSRGMGVRLLQNGLRSMGYATSTGGRFDAATARAVIAYRKVNRMARRTSATRRILGRVMAGEGAFRLRYPRAGRHVEFDWSRQVLVLARDGRVERVYHASSGKASTPTVFGTFRFYRKTPGTNAKGMVHSSYFIRGYAIHGYRSVPTRPASHGCIRVPIPNAWSVSRSISLGDRIHVYR